LKRSKTGGGFMYSIAGMFHGRLIHSNFLGKRML